MSKRMTALRRRGYSGISVPAIFIGNVTKSDGGGSATFYVTLSRAHPQQVTVNYATANGSATAGNDYTAVSGTLTFAAGEASKTIAVPILGDVLVEGSETFSCVLSSPTNATLGNATGVCTLADDNTTPFGKPAGNVGAATYYDNNRPFINLTRSSGSWLSANYPERAIPENANGWLTGLANTDAVNLVVFQALSSQSGYVRPGNYKAVTTCGAKISVSATSGAGITNRSSPAVNQCTFTVATSGTGVYGSDYLLWILVNNDTGGTINVTDLAIYHVDDEADHQAGKIFQAGFLATLQNLNTIRALDWTRANSNSNGGAPFTPAMLPTESNRLWDIGDVPYSVIGKMVNELKAAYPGVNPWLHVTTPSGVELYAYSSDVPTSTFTTKVAHNNNVLSHGWSNGQPVVLYGYKGPVDTGWPTPLSKGVTYYVVNSTPTTFQLAATPGGAAITLTGTTTTTAFSYIGAANVDVAALVNEVFAQLYAAAPGIRIKAEYTNEPWNSAFNQYHWLYTVMALQAGSSLNMQAGYAYGSLLTWKAAELAGYSRANVKRVMGGQAANWAAWSSMLEYVDPGIITAGQPTKNLVDEWCIAPYGYAVNSGGTILTNAAMIAAGLGTGSDADWTAVMGRGTTLAASWVATHVAGIAAKNPAIELSTYECGHHLYQQGTLSGLDVLAARFQSWLDSAAGLAWAQDYRQRVFIDTELNDFCWYTLSGQWAASTSSLYCWGMRKGTHNPPTAIATWFSALT